MAVEKPQLHVDFCSSLQQKVGALQPVIWGLFIVRFMMRREI